MTPTLPSEVLDAAAELITPEGAWGQGGCGNVYSNCAMTAIWKAGKAGGGNAASAYLHRTLEASDDYAVFGWNDDPNRTQAEVISALRRAAELARSENS